MEKRLILLSAAAGSGKTALLAEWLGTSRRKTAWISLDKGESDPLVFVAYLAAALGKLFPGSGEEVERLLAHPMSPTPESVIAALVNDFADIEEPFFLALDDYQEIDSRRTDEVLAFLVERGPRAMRVAMASREDPGLPLARLRARGQLLELRAEDLRFTDDEASAYLRASGVTALPAGAEAAILHRVEGWIAGLHLVALSLRGQEDPSRIIEGLTKGNRFILDYLVEEVMARQSPEIQDFLLKTSILERFCGPLCDAVMGEEGQGRPSAPVLRELERSNLFLVPLDSEGNWYRYHRLFRGFLEQRLGADGGLKDGINEARLRASAWLEANGSYLDAFRQALAAKDVGRAAFLVMNDAYPFHERESVNEALDWLATLVAGELEERPALAVRYATLLLARGRRQGVEGILAAAERALSKGETGAATPGLAASLAIARATLALTRYDIQGMSIHAKLALERLGPGDEGLRGTACWIQGLGRLLGGDLDGALASSEETLVASRLARNPFTAMLAMAVKGQAEEGKGRLGGAEATYRELLALAGEHPQPVASEARFGLARIAYERDDEGNAESQAREGIELARQYGEGIDRSIVGELILVRLEISRGDAEGAERHAAALARDAAQKGFAQRIPEIAALRSLAAARAGRPQEALALAMESASPPALAAVSLESGAAAEALEAVEPFLAIAERRGWIAEAIRASLLKALALRDLGRREESLALLRRVLVPAEEGGYVRSFLDLGPSMVRLLSEIRDSEGEIPYASVLLGRRRGARGPAGAFNAGDQAVAAESGREKSLPSGADPGGPLSRRETEILRLVEQGLSNEEICERLFIALDTVKGHNRKIFEKLRVKRRTEAVARARALGII